VAPPPRRVAISGAVATAGRASGNGHIGGRTSVPAGEVHEGLLRGAGRLGRLRRGGVDRAEDLQDRYFQPFDGRDRRIKSRTLGLFFRMQAVTEVAPRLGITAVIPCLNEAAGLAHTYAEVSAQLDRYDAELLFIDDGSGDRTLELIKSFAAGDPRVSYISFTRNFGQEAAISAGFRYAAKPWIVQLDADLQFPPAEIHSLVARAIASQSDVVFGIRRQRQDGTARTVASRLQHWIARRVLNIAIPDGRSPTGPQPHQKANSEAIIT
jgi:hypothetical protein